MRYNIYIALLLMALTGGSCRQNQNIQTINPNDLSGGAISVEDTKFVDSFGRQVIFNGINYVNKDPDINYIPKDSSATFAKFKNWGFNCIRLGVIWDGVEPQPGQFDEKYLDKIEEQVNWATQNGLYVMLDMHQDLFSRKFSDGAPLWATLTDDQPHMQGFMWSDSYFISPAVQHAFDNFWANKAVSDGMGIQDHYAKMWQHVANRFAGNKTIIGFDIMNEPFNGTQGTLILPVILAEYAKLYAEETGTVLTEKEIMDTWSDEESRLRALTRLQSGEKYSRVIKAATALSHQFEKTDLQAMYQRVGNAIREVDTTHILFLEHAYFSNAGVLSGIEPVRRRNGKTDALVAYAAHGYDLLLDTKINDAQSSERVEYIFSRINETSRRINIPVLVGEWGAFGGNSEGAAASAQFIRKLFDRFHFGNTYWAYGSGMDKDYYFHKTFDRPFPQYTGGTLKTCEFDYLSGLFSCSWEESSSVIAPTVIYIPDLRSLNKESIKLTIESSKTIIQPIEKSNAGYLIIPVTGISTERGIRFEMNTDLSTITIKKDND